MIMSVSTRCLKFTIGIEDLYRVFFAVCHINAVDSAHRQDV